MSSRLDSRRSLGTVSSVSADRFTVQLRQGSDSFTLVGFDGQHYVARIGSYVLIPVQTAYIVAEVVGLRETDGATNAPTGFDYAESAAIGSSKSLEVVPVGTLPFRLDSPFRFGISVFPPLYADALYTQTHDLDRILDVSGATEPASTGSTHTRTRAFDVGTSVVFDDYAVKVRVNEFFGGHAAILGNTGSGKSCTVASILQSIFNKPERHYPIGASFVVFDTNGEYREALSEFRSPIRRTYAKLSGAETQQLEVINGQESALAYTLPHWFLSAEEWDLLLQASQKAQRPALRSALGLTSLFATPGPGLESTKDHILASAIRSILATSDSGTSSASRIQGLINTFNTENITRSKITRLTALNYGQLIKADELNNYLDEYVLDDIVIPEYSNAPFAFETLGPALELAILYEESHGNRQIRDYCSSLLTRLKSVSTRADYAFLRVDPQTMAPHERSVIEYVNLILGWQPEGGGENKKMSQITIIDLNESEDEAVEIIAAVTSRLIFERLRRREPRNSTPVNVILEEAHRYVAARPSDYALDASRIFDRIAKEGRKYGLFLMLASQRPSELSGTVLSQCSNYVVHRIQNPEDLQHIRRMAPFVSEAVMTRLPSLPKQHALIFGSAVSVPTTFRVRNANPIPKSDDAKISALWYVENVEGPL
ncbi:DNA helicase HerA-like ATPase [Clavibacter sp. B3I6]|uniref:ATP-binding protein n=1 Tax=Clavibacter sp. B3I6 TaxID=3042268 RepID=UPI0027816DDC|nr:DUF87 domain-containing protein [Clavibacter sp. B3I6]MDQ0745706.1 DNA helicase HerA-like ATPase [Clavibacter sp. B3I6]